MHEVIGFPEHNPIGTFYTANQNSVNKSTVEMTRNFEIFKYFAHKALQFKFFTVRGCLQKILNVELACEIYSTSFGEVKKLSL